jgi:enoyl-CoA hydratase
MRDLSADTKITVERRGQIVLIGINRPQMFNRIDPEAFYGLASAYYDFDNDATLRAAVLFGHGESFSRVSSSRVRRLSHRPIGHG